MIFRFSISFSMISNPLSFCLSLCISTENHFSQIITANKANRRASNQQNTQIQRNRWWPTSKCSRSFFWRFYYSFAAEHYSFNVSIWIVGYHAIRRNSCRFFVCACALYVCLKKKKPYARCKNAKRLINDSIQMLFEWTSTKSDLNIRIKWSRMERRMV